MSEESNAIVYSKNVIEMVTVAKEYTAFLERASEYGHADFLNHTQKLLPLIYLKGCLLPEPDYACEEEEVEQFVSETDWTFISNSISEVLGSNDDFYEVFSEQLFDTEGGEQLSISEMLADIYQDLKNFIELYRFGNEESILDALFVLKQSFSEYWGFKTTIALKAVHRVIYFGAIEEDELDSESDDKGTFFQKYKDSHLK